MRKIIIGLCALLALPLVVQAEGKEPTVTEKEKLAYIQKAQEKLKATFIRMQVTDFGESPIPGIYEVVTGNRVIYFHPEKELLIFGEIYTKDGKSLTRSRMQKEQMKRVAKLDLKEAMIIGSGDKKIIEFTDPECPYCQAFHAYAKKEGMNEKVTRYVFFTPIRQRHPNAHKKAIHVLCSENKEQAFDDVLSNRLDYGQLTSCKEGEDWLARQEQISSQFGVQGTPTLVLEDSVITGFNQARIAQFLTNETKRGKVK